MAGFGASFSANGSFGSFLRRRLSELAGVALFLGSIVLFLVLATYDRHDPSWNVASDRMPANFGGPTGAVLADALIQALGFVPPYLLPMIATVWSLRLLLNWPVRLLWLRLLLIPAVLILAAISLGILPGRIGGVTGLIFWNRVAIGPAEPLVAMGIAAFAGVLLLYVLGLSRGEWVAVGRGAGRVARVGGKAGRTTWRWGMGRPSLG